MEGVYSLIGAVVGAVLAIIGRFLGDRAQAGRETASRRRELRRDSYQDLIECLFNEYMAGFEFAHRMQAVRKQQIPPDPLESKRLYTEAKGRNIATAAAMARVALVAPGDTVDKGTELRGFVANMWLEGATGGEEESTESKPDSTETFNALLEDFRQLAVRDLHW
jgi:hypothetical protein